MDGQGGDGARQRYWASVLLTLPEFCQTPAWSFPFELHFLMPFVHWLPRKLGYLLVHVSPWRLLSHPDAPTIRNDFWGTQLLRRAEIDALFPTAALSFEKSLGLVKSYYVIDRAPAGEPGQRTRAG